MFAGISPKNVAKKKYLKGTPTIGDAKFISQFGNKGVILKKSKKKNRLSLFFSIKFLNCNTLLEHNLYMKKIYF